MTTKEEFEYIEFTKEKLQTKCSRICTDSKVFIQQDGPDAIMQAVETWIATRTREVQEITIHPKRQGFLDYIFGRRPKAVTIKVNCKDIMKNPPPNIPVITIYEPETLNQ